jgi:hypothetical protein
MYEILYRTRRRKDVEKRYLPIFLIELAYSLLASIMGTSGRHTDAHHEQRTRDTGISSPLQQGFLRNLGPQTTLGEPGMGTQIPPIL